MYTTGELQTNKNKTYEIKAKRRTADFLVVAINNGPPSCWTVNAARGWFRFLWLVPSSGTGFAIFGFFFSGKLAFGACSAVRSSFKTASSLFTRCALLDEFLFTHPTCWTCLESGTDITNAFDEVRAWWYDYGCSPTTQCNGVAR
jgi:hypothetical protein